MSAPRTNIDIQRRWHRGPLLGIAAVMVFSTVIGALILFDAFGGSTQDREPGVMIDGRTGEPVLPGTPNVVQPVNPPVVTPEPQVNPPAGVTGN